MALLSGITLLTFYSSIGWKYEMVYVLLDETEEEREFFSHNGGIAQDIYDLIGYGQEDHTAGNGMYFWMTSEALALFQEGGELYEKYQEYCFPERMVLQQMIGGEIASPEQRDFETRQRFYWLLTDPSAAYITAVIFAAFFLGESLLYADIREHYLPDRNEEKFFLGTI